MDRGAGGTLLQAGEEMVESGIPKVKGSGGSRKMFLQHCIMFCNRDSTQEAGPPEKRAGTGNWDYRECSRSGQFRPTVPPPPLAVLH